jgi:hypothetical protein
VSRVAAAAAALLALACATSPEPGGPSGSPPPPEEVEALRERAEAFYRELAARRFNTLETFEDPALRQHFRSLDLFFDYYADLAQALAEAHFERSRPVSVAVEELRFEDPEHARLRVRFVGEDGRPLRFDSASLLRTDLWERQEGQWWITPARL